MEITVYWKIRVCDDLEEVKRKAALKIAREFAYSEYTKRLSSVSHELIEADGYVVTGFSTMEVGN